MHTGTMPLMEDVAAPTPGHDTSPHPTHDPLVDTRATAHHPSSATIHPPLTQLHTVPFSCRTKPHPPLPHHTEALLQRVSATLTLARRELRQRHRVTRECVHRLQQTRRRGDTSVVIASEDNDMPIVAQYGSPLRCARAKQALARLWMQHVERWYAEEVRDGLWKELLRRFDALQRRLQRLTCALRGRYALRCMYESALPVWGDVSLSMCEEPARSYHRCDSRDCGARHSRHEKSHDLVQEELWGQTKTGETGEEELLCPADWVMACYVHHVSPSLNDANMSEACWFAEQPRRLCDVVYLLTHVITETMHELTGGHDERCTDEPARIANHGSRALPHGSTSAVLPASMRLGSGGTVTQTPRAHTYHVYADATSGATMSEHAADEASGCHVDERDMRTTHAPFGVLHRHNDNGNNNNISELVHYQGVHDNKESGEQKSAHTCLCAVRCGGHDTCTTMAASELTSRAARDDAHVTDTQIVKQHWLVALFRLREVWRCATCHANCPTRPRPPVCDNNTRVSTSALDQLNDLCRLSPSQPGTLQGCHTCARGGCGATRIDAATASRCNEAYADVADWMERCRGAWLTAMHYGCSVRRWQSELGVRNEKDTKGISVDMCNHRCAVMDSKEHLLNDPMEDHTMEGIVITQSSISSLATAAEGEAVMPADCLCIDQSYKYVQSEEDGAAARGDDVRWSYYQWLCSHVQHVHCTWLRSTHTILTDAAAAYIPPESAPLASWCACDDLHEMTHTIVAPDDDGGGRVCGAEMWTGGRPSNTNVPSGLGAKRRGRARFDEAAVSLCAALHIPCNSDNKRAMYKRRRCDGVDVGCAEDGPFAVAQGARLATCDEEQRKGGPPAHRPLQVPCRVSSSWFRWWIRVMALLLERGVCLGRDIRSTYDTPSHATQADVTERAASTASSELTYVLVCEDHGDFPVSESELHMARRIVYQLFRHCPLLYDIARSM